MSTKKNLSANTCAHKGQLHMVEKCVMFVLISSFALSATFNANIEQYVATGDRVEMLANELNDGQIKTVILFPPCSLSGITQARFTVSQWTVICMCDVSVCERRMHSPIYISRRLCLWNDKAFCMSSFGFWLNLYRQLICMSAVSMLHTRRVHGKFVCIVTTTEWFDDIVLSHGHRCEEVFAVAKCCWSLSQIMMHAKRK